MKQLVYFIIAFALYFFVQATASAQSFKVEGKTYSSVSSNNRTKTEPEKTDFIWTDRKGNEYPIYISSTGSCFVVKTSAKTGKEYRNYLKADISEDICNKLNRKYVKKAVKKEE